MTPLLRSIIHQNDRTRENTLLTVTVYCKGCNSGTARWRRCTEQGGWEGVQSSHALSGHTTFLGVFTNPELSEPRR